MLTSTMAVFPGLLPPEHQKIIKLRRDRPGYEATFEGDLSTPLHHAKAQCNILYLTSPMYSCLD